MNDFGISSEQLNYLSDQVRGKCVASEYIEKLPPRIRSKIKENGGYMNGEIVMLLAYYYCRYRPEMWA